jgi:tetratricopeptide (TPR) repeat protein
MNLSIIHLQQGKLDDAKDGIQEAIAASKQLGDQSDNATALQILGDVLLAEDDLKGADTAYTSFLNIQSSLGQPADIATARLSLAGLELERAQPGKAEDYARQAADEFNKEKSTDAEALARSALIKALLQQGKVADARIQVDLAEKLQSSDKMIKLDLAIAVARVLSEEKKYTESAHRLNDVIGATNKMGLVGYELDARLALGENQIASGQRGQGLTTLRKVQIDAGRQGLTLAARKSVALVKAVD